MAMGTFVTFIKQGQTPRFCSTAGTIWIHNSMHETIVCCFAVKGCAAQWDLRFWVDPVLAHFYLQSGTANVRLVPCVITSGTQDKTNKVCNPRILLLVHHVLLEKLWHNEVTYCLCMRDLCDCLLQNRACSMHGHQLFQDELGLSLHLEGWLQIYSACQIPTSGSILGLQTHFTFLITLISSWDQ